MHRTFRSLDQRPKLLGFTIRQWAGLLLLAGLLGALVHFTRMPVKPAISLCTIALGLPTALAFVAETGGPQIALLLREMLGWRARRKHLPATPAGYERRGVQLTHERENGNAR
jgi:hypothetical protein